MAKSRTAPRTSGQILDEVGIDLIAEMIGDGRTLRQISAQLRVPLTSLADWLRADVGRTARARDARKHVAEDADQQAEDILRALPADATQAQIAQARELASHYRWRAKAFAPHLYGERVQQEISGPGGGPVEVVARPVLSREEWLRAHGITVDNGPRDGSAGDTPGGDDPAPTDSGND